MGVDAVTETPEQDIWYTRVQQLAQRIAAKDAEIAQLRSEVAALENRNLSGYDERKDFQK